MSGRGRSVPAVYGVVSLVLVAGALTFALSSPPPSTPPLAAVAPAPQDQIEVERVEQSSRFGEGAGGEGDCVPGDPGCGGVADPPGDADDPVAPTPQEPPSPPSSTESWRCSYGGRTQTDDPQSPPCFGPRFVGDNGGATSTGVTATEIRVAWPTVLDENGNPDAHDRRLEDALLEHVNRRYERYGRRIVYEFVDVSGYTDGTPASARALAREVAAREVFASLSFSGASPAFHRELALSGVVSVMHPGRPATTEAFLRDLHPYVWSVLPTIDEAMAASARLICDALAGRPAQHAGADLAQTTRRFGVIVEREDGERLDASRLLGGLEACAAPHQVVEHDHDAPGASDALETAIRKLAADGVTSVVCVCHKGVLRAADAAQSAGYRPEWLLSGHVSDEDVAKMHRDQRGHTFGLTSGFRWLSSPVGTTSGSRRFDEQFWYHAMKDGDPDAETASDLAPHYQQLLVLAAGIQWAGPELTPASFGDALAGLTFANPDVGRPRWYQPAVTLGRSDHGWNSDFALLWWRNSTPEEERVSPSFQGEPCYVGDGLRYTATSIPTDADELLFDPEAGCR